MTLSCVIYPRYSSENQEERSIDDQTRICQAYAERERWNVVAVLPDFAISGATLLRPGYQRLLEMVRGRAIDVVLAESLHLARPGAHRGLLQADVLERRPRQVQVPRVEASRRGRIELRLRHALAHGGDPAGLAHALDHVDLAGCEGERPRRGVGDEADA